MELETKILHASVAFKFSEKAAKEEDEEFFHIEGYASTFGNVDLGGDVIAAGAFLKSLGTMMPKMVYQHNMADPIGVWDSASEDESGLYVKGRMPKDNSKCRDIMALMKCGAIDSMSIGYSVEDAEYMDNGNVRLLKQIKLYEVSPVTFPMNPKAKITGVKSEDGDSSTNEDDAREKIFLHHLVDLKSKKDVEQFLIKNGFSRKAAKYMISKDADFQRDAEKSTETPDLEDCRDAFEKIISELKTIHNILRG